MTPEITSTFSKSSYSDQQGDCLEIAETAHGGRAIRDSKGLAGPLLHLGSGPWSAFLDAVKTDAFSADA
ncbi:DUF397 domain-containing protein [Streptomyces sp. ML-6]|uniref:DUF397 domain-containing protein n=1 Tax=Streptomyces sp. ML-6 TaxID=2982693 RepID=UPI0024C01FEA|nr:DUF397 domain-containing protein [Streptomyces sp. ML-6]MDK0520664.1 DUF397 domain-containing protein [Streptomyces sp. ML-6]